MGFYDRGWRPYVPVAERRRRAAKEIARLKKGGHTISPVEIAGRTITATFWGNAWCRNLEAYSDYANRLPRGRRYVCNGSVLDLHVEPGRVRALVSGTEIYEVQIRIKPLSKKRWTEIKSRCMGQIGSVVELLRGAISESVMEIVTRKGEGLFPAPREIELDCSCPDWAVMCKHVAAALYGVGARLDARPELLFTLRGVDPAELVEAAVDLPAGADAADEDLLLQGDGLSSIFGVDVDDSPLPSALMSARRAYVKPGISTTGRGRRRRNQKPYSAKSKAALLRAYQDLRATGSSVQAAARQVGVPYITLRSWEKKGFGA